MKFKKLLFIALIIIITLTSSCVYLRLLTLKTQFQDFDNYFKFNDKPALICIKPVLLPEDILFLTNTKPSKVILKNKEDFNWHFKFKKVSFTKNNEQSKYDLYFNLNFKNKTLYEVEYPKIITSMIPDYFISNAFKSTGFGTFDESKKTLYGSQNKEFQVNPKDLPTIKDVIKHFGKPTSRKKLKDKTTLLYYRYIQTFDPSSNEKPVRSWIRFYFRESDQKITKVGTTIFGPYMQFSLPIEE